MFCGDPGSLKIRDMSYWTTSSTGRVKFGKADKGRTVVD